MENKMEEQIIYPKDLLFAAMYRWRAMVAVGLVLAILLGGYQFAQGLKNGTADAAAQAAYEEALAEYEEERAPLEERVIHYKNEVEMQKQYMAESLLLSLDPYGHYRGTLLAYVSTDYQIQPEMDYQTPDRLDYILASYDAKLRSDAMIAALAETAGLEWRLFNEIYTVTVNESVGTLEVSLRHSDENMAKTLLEQVAVALTDARKELSEAIGEHTVTVLEQSTSLVVDTLIATFVRDNWNHLDYLEQELAAAEIALDALQEPVQPQAGGVSLKKVILLAALGFIAGAAVVAVVAWFSHMESDKAYSARLLQLRTGVKLLGTLPQKKSCFIDRAIRKWEGRDSSDPAQKAAVLACDIRNRCTDVQTLLVTGSGRMEERQVLMAALRAAMTEVKVIDAGSVLADTAAVESLANADAVVLVEQCFRATCSGVYNEMQTVVDYGKHLIGCVVLDG